MLPFMAQNHNNKLNNKESTMKKLLFIICIIFCPTLYANPSPFGLELNKTTVDEAEDKYSLLENGINYYSNGPMYYVDSRDLSVDGLKNMLLIFSENNVLLAVQATFSKSKFDSLNNNLSKKYKTIKKDIPFVGNKYVKYKDDQSLIILDAPHMSFELTLLYTLADFDKKVNSISKENKNKENNNEYNLL